MKYVNHIQTPNSLIVMFDKGSPRTVKKNQKAYDEILELIRLGRLDQIPQLSSTAGQIEHGTRGAVKVVNGKAVIQGEQLPIALSKRLVNMVNQKVPVTPLVNFWNRLKKNPSKDSVQDLYGFLEFNHVPLLPDGCFIAYKSVRSDFMDCHSGTFDNSPGQTPKMDRSKVDPNRNNTCSRGLHVAAYGYAATQYAGKLLLDVKVDPEDVVAVPRDYGQQKMRECKYTVIGVHKGGEFKEEVIDKKPKKITRMTLKSTRGFVPIISECTEKLLEIDNRKPVYVIVTDPRSRFLFITQDGTKTLDDIHFVQKFNRGKPVYATKDALAAAKIGGSNYYMVKKIQGGVILRKEKK